MGGYIDKAYVVEHYTKLLDAGVWDQRAIDRFLETGEVADSEIIHISSGSSGQPPLRVPRTAADLANFGKRLIEPYVQHYNEKPRKNVLIGGLTHAQAPVKFRDPEIEIREISVNSLSEIQHYDPNTISCYPSVLREILADDTLTLPALRYIRVAGEALFESDVRKTFERFPNIVFYEYASASELPGFARRRLDGSSWGDIPYWIDTRRFHVMEANGDGWQPLAIRDDFPGLILQFGDYYANGDDGRFQDGQLMEIRSSHNRRYAALEPYLVDFLASGCTNAQIDTQNKIIRYYGKATLQSRIKIEGLTYTTEKCQIARIKHSNKLKLFV